MAARKKSGSAFGQTGKAPGSSPLDVFGKATSTHPGTGWDEVHPEHIGAVVIAASLCGAAAMFGRSRDGSSLSVTIFLGKDKRTLWIGPEVEPEDELERIAATLAGLAE